jgi:hypothetical protein
MASDDFGLTPSPRRLQNSARVRPKRLSSFLDSSNNIKLLLAFYYCKGHASKGCAYLQSLIEPVTFARAINMLRMAN